MRNINKISIHTSDSSWGDVNAIRSWHLERGWSDVGYHYIIKNGILRYKSDYIESLDGDVDVGRPITKIPSAVKHYNTGMIAICLIGKNGKYTPKQLMKAIELCSDLMDIYKLPLEVIKGHYEYPNVTKTCPDINMDNFRLAIKSYREGLK